MWVLKTFIFVSLFSLLGYVFFSLGLLQDSIVYIIDAKNYMTMLPDWFRIVIGMILFGLIGGFIFGFLKD